LATPSLHLHVVMHCCDSRPGYPTDQPPLCFADTIASQALRNRKSPSLEPVLATDLPTPPQPARALTACHHPSPPQGPTLDKMPGPSAITENDKQALKSASRARKTATSAGPAEHRVPFFTDQGHVVEGTRRPAPAHTCATLHRPTENPHADPVPISPRPTSRQYLQLDGNPLAQQQIAVLTALQDPTTGWNTP